MSNNKTRIRVPLTLPKMIVEDLDYYCNKLKRTRSSVMEEAISSYLEKHNINNIGIQAARKKETNQKLNAIDENYQKNTGFKIPEEMKNFIINYCEKNKFKQSHFIEEQLHKFFNNEFTDDELEYDWGNKNVSQIRITLSPEIAKKLYILSEMDKRTKTSIIIIAMTPIFKTFKDQYI